MQTVKSPEFKLGKIVLSTPAHCTLGEIVERRFPQLSDNRIFYENMRIVFVNELLAMHRRLEQGLLGKDDYQANFDAVKYEGDPDRQFRVFSSFEYHENKFWIITEHDRSCTTILLPEDY